MVATAYLQRSLPRAADTAVRRIMDLVILVEVAAAVPEITPEYLTMFKATSAPAHLVKVITAAVVLVSDQAQTTVAAAVVVRVPQEPQVLPAEMAVPVVAAV